MMDSSEGSATNIKNQPIDQRVIHGLVRAAALISFIGILSIFYVSYLKLNYRYPLNLGDGALTQAIQYFHKGILPYKSINEPPYFLVPYGPVYLALGALFYSLGGQPFFAGRVIGFLAMILASAIVFIFLRKNRGRFALSFIIASLFVFHPYVQRWALTVNVDMSAAALAVTGFYFLWSWSTESKYKSNLYMGFGMLFCTLSFFTKSSMISAPLSFFVYLLIQRLFRQAFIYAGIQGMIIIVIYGFLNLITFGQYFFHTTYEISRRLFFAQFIQAFWMDVFRTAPFLIFAAFWTIILHIKRKQWDYFFLYFMLSACVTVSLGKQGSDTNYLLEWTILAFINLGMVFNSAYQFFLEHSKTNRVFYNILCLILSGLLLVQAVAFTLPLTQWGKIKKTFDEKTRFYDRMSLFIQKTRGKVLCEEPGLLIANGKEIFYEPFPFGQMVYSGVWDPAPVLDVLERQEFSMALLYSFTPYLKQNRTFPPQIIKKFNEKYEFAGSLLLPGEKEPSGQRIYLYKPRAGA